MTIVTIMWRRLDIPGHDGCRLLRAKSANVLEGTAVFRHQDEPAVLRYKISTDAGWVSRQAQICGWIGERAIDFMIERTGSGALSPKPSALV